MIITLNSFPINDGSNSCWLDGKAGGVSGLELPTVRTSTGNYAGKDGGYIGAQFFSARDITIYGVAFSSDVSTLETTRKALQAALLGDSVAMTILTNAGASYTVYANLLDFQMPIKDNVFSASFKIELLAGDPTIYETSVSELTAGLSLQTSGGYTYPVVYPVIYAGGSLPQTVTNAGTVAVYPTITLTGLMTDPVLTNNTTLEQFALNITTSSSDVVVINMQQHTVLLNGGNIIGDVGTDSTWWGLLPGDNSITLSSASSGDTVTGVISWLSGVMGI